MSTKHDCERFLLDVQSGEEASEPQQPSMFLLISFVV